MIQFVLAIGAAIIAYACSDGGEGGSIPPLDKPDGAPPPPKPKDVFKQGTRLKFDLRGITYPPSVTSTLVSPATVPPSGCTFFRISQQDLSVDGTGNFRLSATWDSAPLKCVQPPPDGGISFFDGGGKALDGGVQSLDGGARSSDGGVGSVCSSATFGRIATRSSGSLSQMRRSGMSQSWGGAYPDAATLGLTLFIQGTVNLSTGEVKFARITSRGSSGKDSGKFVLPLYSDSQNTCRADIGFSNEGLAHLGGPAIASLSKVSGYSGVVTLGSGAPSGVQVQMTLIPAK